MSVSWRGRSGEKVVDVFNWVMAFASAGASTCACASR